MKRRANIRIKRTSSWNPNEVWTGRRVRVQEILADEGFRKEMLVPALQVIQNREGIPTTREQAEAAYDKVRKETLPPGPESEKKPGGTDDRKEG